MRQARIFVNNVAAGILEERDDGTFQFIYDANYSGIPVSLTMPISQKKYLYTHFPP